MDIKGLTDKEVKESRAKFGSNEIPDSEPTTFWQEFKETFQDPMIKILLAIAVLMIVMFFFGYAEIYEPMGTIIAVYAKYHPQESYPQIAIKPDPQQPRHQHRSLQSHHFCVPYTDQQRSVRRKQPERVFILQKRLQEIHLLIHILCFVEL